MNEERQVPRMAGSYSIGEHYERFIKDLVASGRYNNESEVVRDGLRHVELHYLKLKALRKHLRTAVQQGGNYSDDDVATILANDDAE